MAGTRSKRVARDLVGKDPTRLAPEELDALIHECERKIEIMEGFAESEEWKLSRKRLETRRDNLAHEMAGLIRRMTRPVMIRPGEPTPPPVTPEQIAYQQGRIDENVDLLRFPIVTVQLWRQQIAQLRELRERSTS